MRRYCSGARCIFTATWGRWCHKQSEGSRGDAEGDSRVGFTSRKIAPARSRRPSRDGKAQGDEAGRCRSDRDRGHRRDAVLLPVPREHWCCLRTNNPRGAAARSAASGVNVPGRQVSPDVGRGEIASCSQHEEGHASLPGHETSDGSESSTTALCGKHSGIVPINVPVQAEKVICIRPE